MLDRFRRHLNRERNFPAILPANERNSVPVQLVLQLIPALPRQNGLSTDYGQPFPAWAGTASLAAQTERVIRSLRVCQSIEPRTPWPGASLSNHPASSANETRPKCPPRQLPDPTLRTPGLEYAKWSWSGSPLSAPAHAVPATA